MNTHATQNLWELYRVQYPHLIADGLEVATHEFIGEPERGKMSVLVTHRDSNISCVVRGVKLPPRI